MIYSKMGRRCRNRTDILPVIRKVSLVTDCATIYANRLFVFIVRIWIKVIHIGFPSFPCSPDCNIFMSAYTDNSSFRCSSSYYLMQNNWISVCRASFRQVTALIALSGYFFSTHTILCLINMSKNTTVFKNPSWCKIVDARTTYFIRLKDLPLHHLGKLAETI